MLRTIKNRIPWIIAGAMLAAPRAASACSVCMGRSDDVATRGLNAAILTLLAALVLVQGSIAGFLTYVIRRSAKHPVAPPSTPRGAVR